MERGDHGAEHGLPFVEVLLGAQHEVVGQRFHRLAAQPAVEADGGRLAGGQRVQDAERQAAARLAGDLEGAQDRGRRGHVEVLAGGGLGLVARGAADAPRVEEVVHAEVAVAAHDAEVEDALAPR